MADKDKGAGNVRVVVRFRPQSQSEILNGGTIRRKVDLLRLYPMGDYGTYTIRGSVTWRAFPKGDGNAFNYTESLALQIPE